MPKQRAVRVVSPRYQGVPFKQVTLHHGNIPHFSFYFHGLRAHLSANAASELESTFMLCTFIYEI